MTVYRFKIAVALSLLAAGLSVISCDNQKNSPYDVIRDFIGSIENSSELGIDSLLNWEEVLLSENYISEDVYAVYSDSVKIQEINGFREVFYENYLPLIKNSDYRIKKVIVSRNESDATLEMEYRDTGPGTREKTGVRAMQTRVRMRLNPKTGYWKVIELGDIVHYNMVQGKYDPMKIYLNE